MVKTKKNAEQIEAAPLIALRAYQQPFFWRDDLRRAGLLWRRQAGKSTTLAGIALRRMMSRPDHECIFASASVRLGVEFVRKESRLWMKLLDWYRGAASASGLKLESNADGLDFDAVCDLFEHQKLETKIFHGHTSYSRSVVVAANPDTAVGWTGDIFLDEFGRIPELQDVLEAVYPFIDNNPNFILRMATTPPPDDAHYSWEMLVPPQEEFPVNREGNWYRSQAGILVHRADVYDCYAAGLLCYDRESGDALNPDEHRAREFDKAAWDRNYGLRFIRGGVAALSLQSIFLAMERGKDKGMCNAVTEEIAVA